jgi:hypothetical protein
LAIVLSVLFLLAIVLSVLFLLAIVLSVLFLLAIVLSVLFRITGSNYHCCIFELFLNFYICRKQLENRWVIEIILKRMTFVMKRKLKQWWSTISPISTKRTITSHHLAGHKKKPNDKWHWKSSCGGFKLVNRIQTPPFGLVTEYSTAIYNIDKRSKNLHRFTFTPLDHILP